MKTKIQLPEQCFHVLLSTNQIIVIKKGEHGYHEYSRQPDRMTAEEAEELCNELNERIGVTRGQRMAMEFGSMTTWEGKGADPNNWSKDGHWIDRKKTVAKN